MIRHLAGTALFVVVCAGAGVSFGVLITKTVPRDDTDPPAGSRSGMSLYVDHRTGCHYLAAGIGQALTPRLDRDGRHLCEPHP